MYDKSIHFFREDLSESMYLKIMQQKVVAVDTETSGLDWKTENIGVCQFYAPDVGVCIVQCSDRVPNFVCKIISSSSINKVFHFAVFDLRFMVNEWNLIPINISCTKLASKILNPEGEHSLKGLINKYLNIEIIKDQRTSNWLAKNLSSEQVSYIINDVLYLLELLNILEDLLDKKCLMEITRMSFKHIPTQVQLDLLGVSNPYGFASE